MQHDFFAQCRHVRIRPLQEQDIEIIRQWRNEALLSRFLRPIGHITPGMQRRWYEAYLSDQDQLMFAIEMLEGSYKMVGSFALYHFSEDTAEIGKIVIGDPNAHGKKIGFFSFLLGLYISFENLHIEIIHLDVHEGNTAARKIYEEIGFAVVGKHPFVNGGTELEMALTKERFMQLHTTLLQEVIV